MNIHPFIVHFPIALLAVYTVLEVAHVHILQRQQWFFPVKALLLIAGMGSGVLALQSGELAEHAWKATDARSLIEMHSAFAAASMWVYGILAALYGVEWAHREGLWARLPRALHGVSSFLRSVQKPLFTAPLLIIGSLIGFALLGITGALGGAIVYGPDVDPVVSLVYTLLIGR